MDSLYEISSELESLMSEAEMHAADNDGVLPDILSEKIDSLEMQKSEKIGNIARFIKNLTAEAGMVDAEAKALSARKKSVSNKAEWLKKYLANFVGVGQKYADENVSIGWRKSVSTIIDDADLVPDEYCKIERKVSATDVKKAIVSGIEISGAHLQENQSIQIK